MKNLRKTQWNQRLNFLNHLCDEELDHIETIDAEIFLNHLCDEEREIYAIYFAGEFLNHLCDEEQ